MRMFCTVCDSEQEVVLIQKAETYPVKGEDVSINATVCVCPKCGNELWNEDIDDENLRSAYRVYRERHALLQPEEIKKIRLMYGLSQTAFSRVLGLGDKTIARYENGSIQDSAQNNLIDLMRNPRNMEELFSRNKDKLTGGECNAICKALDAMRVKIVYSGTPAVNYTVSPNAYWKEGEKRYA